MLSLSKKRKNMLENLVENSSTQEQNFKKSVYEKNQKQNLSTFSFFWMQLVSFIPLVNLIPLFFWSFNSKVNENKKSFARSSLIWCAVFTFLILFLFLTVLFLKYPLDFSFWFKKFQKILIDRLKAK